MNVIMSYNVNFHSHQFCVLWYLLLNISDVFSWSLRYWCRWSSHPPFFQVSFKGRFEHPTKPAGSFQQPGYVIPYHQIPLVWKSGSPNSRQIESWRTLQQIRATDFFRVSRDVFPLGPGWFFSWWGLSTMHRQSCGQWVFWRRACTRRLAVDRLTHPLTGDPLTGSRWFVGCGCQGAVFDDCDPSIPFSRRHCWAWSLESGRKIMGTRDTGTHSTILDSFGSMKEHLFRCERKWNYTDAHTLLTHTM